MFNRDHPADEAGAPLYENVVPRVEALLAEYGASHPSELPHEVAAKILHSVLLKIVGPNCPTAALRLLIRAVRRCVRDISSFGHPAFFPAWERVRLSARAPANAFAMATGPDAAVVLAGYGFPVAPFEFGVGVGVLVEPSNDIDEVLAIFSRWTHAIVGYRSCDAPFYVLVTDCVRTLRERILSRPELSEARMLFERSGTPLPSDPGQGFVPGIAVMTRQPGDTISSVGLHDPNPQAGSIALHAGWQIDGKSYGAPDDGHSPVPLQLLRAVVDDPTFGHALSRPISAPSPIH
jgi:hypothetical protein